MVYNKYMKKIYYQIGVDMIGQPIYWIHVISKK